MIIRPYMIIRPMLFYSLTGFPGVLNFPFKIICCGHPILDIFDGASLKS